MVDVRGDVLRPPHGTTPTAVKSNIKYYDETKMRTRQKRVATDTLRSWGVEHHHWRTLEQTKTNSLTPMGQWAKQQTKKLRPQPSKINSFMSGPSLSLTPGPPACS